MIFLVSFLLSVSLVFVGTQFLGFTAPGMPGSHSTNYSVSLLCGLIIFCGILSSILFDRFDKRYTPKTKLFRKTDLLIASILSPIVFLSFYPLMQETQDIIVQFLLAYQNGFFFQNIVARMNGAQGKTPVKAPGKP